MEGNECVRKKVAEQVFAFHNRIPILQMLTELKRIFFYDLASTL